MKLLKPIGKLICFSLTMLLISLLPANALGPTIPQNGIFESISSHQVITAKIDGNIQQVCLPKFEFVDEIDDRELKKKIKASLSSQEAVFNLYHDGLGRPKKQGGMMFASDVYLKDIKMTYTTFLRKMGLNFKVSKTPPHEDTSHLRAVAYNRYIVTEQAAAKEKKDPPTAEPAAKNLSTMRITTIWDVLPKGVIPPSIRRQQKEIEKRIKTMKNRPYRAEVIKMDPVRWASGKMGTLASDGTISESYLEGQNPLLKITPAKESDWLSQTMIDELKGQTCEFIFQLNRSGHEVKESGKYFLRDIYFKNLKLSWEEWLKKHGRTPVDLSDRSDFANNTIDLQVKMVSGKFTGMRAAVIVGADFENKNDLVNQTELIRVFAPKPMPGKFVAFAKKFNQLFNNQPAEFSILMCPDGKPYTELGQKRAQRIYFPKSKDTMQNLQRKLINGQIK